MHKINSQEYRRRIRHSEVIPLSNELNQSEKPTCSSDIPISLCNYKLATTGDQQFRNKKFQFLSPLTTKPFSTCVQYHEDGFSQTPDELFDVSFSVIAFFLPLVHWWHLCEGSEILLIDEHWPWFHTRSLADLSKSLLDIQGHLGTVSCLPGCWVWMSDGIWEESGRCDTSYTS